MLSWNVVTRPGRAGFAETALPSPSPDWAYFFDLDGTLVELASVPAAVHADDALRRLIMELASAAGGAVAIVTGRPISDIDRLFPDLRLPVAGQHGCERRNSLGQVTRHPFASTGLETARRALQQVAARHPALLLEDKGLSLALHYRQAPGLAAYAHRVMHSVQHSIGDGFCVQTGKRVVELKPAGRDKGMAIAEFMDEIPFHGRLPVFIGDDVTDEQGFGVVNERGGMSVKVGRGRTIARWQLQNVRGVRQWLSQHVGRHSQTSPVIGGGTT
jgi:trehalose 6-phosphate phosphatase